MNVEEFYDFIRAVFGDPKIPENADKEEVIGSIMAAYAEALARYSGEALKLASKNMHMTRRHRNFPLLAECLDFCRNAEEEILLRQEREGIAERKTSSDRLNPPEWSEARIRQADRMMDSDVGRQAASEGWIIGLHDWCRENARIPDRYEADEIKALALKNRRIREGLMRKHTGKTLPAIVVIAGKAMEVKSKRLSEIAYGN